MNAEYQNKKMDLLQKDNHLPSLFFLFIFYAHVGVIGVIDKKHTTKSEIPIDLEQ